MKLTPQMIAYAAEWMDRHYPEWAARVQRHLLDMRDSEYCIIGQGSGHAWNYNEADCVNRYVSAAMEMGPLAVSGVTADPSSKPFWLAEIDKRIGVSGEAWE